MVDHSEVFRTKLFQRLGNLISFISAPSLGRCTSIPLAHFSVFNIYNTNMSFLLWIVLHLRICPPKPGIFCNPSSPYSCSSNPPHTMRTQLLILILSWGDLLYRSGFRFEVANSDLFKRVASLDGFVCGMRNCAHFNWIYTN